MKALPSILQYVLFQYNQRVLNKWNVLWRTLLENEKCGLLSTYHVHSSGYCPGLCSFCGCCFFDFARVFLSYNFLGRSTLRTHVSSAFQIYIFLLTDIYLRFIKKIRHNIPFKLIPWSRLISSGCFRETLGCLLKNFSNCHDDPIQEYNQISVSFFANS